MKTRIISSLVMVPTLILLFLGGPFILAGALIVTLIALHEFTNAFGDKKPALWVGYVSIALLYIGYVIFPHSEILLSAWFFLVIVLSFLSMFSMDKRTLMQGFATFVSVFYVVFLVFHIVLVDSSFSTKISTSIGLDITGLHSYVWIIVLTAFGTDIFAYFVGVMFGKHKLCPVISPKKTVEGAIGGLVGSVILCGLFGYFFIPEGFVNCIILGVLGGVTSQLGDLSASIMKRKLEIKDWGAIIPGHGGILDRFDSVLFTAPTVYYFLLIESTVENML